MKAIMKSFGDSKSFIIRNLEFFELQCEAPYSRFIMSRANQKELMQRFS